MHRRRPQWESERVAGRGPRLSGVKLIPDAFSGLYAREDDPKSSGTAGLHVYFLLQRKLDRRGQRAGRNLDGRRLACALQ